MKTLLFIILACACLPGYGQYYQSCIDVPTYADDGTNSTNIRNSIVRNTAGEMAMVGNRKLYKLTAAGVASWEKDLTTDVQDFEIDNNGNVVAIHNGDLSIIKYTAAGAKAWENVLATVALLDATVDADGNVYATGHDYGSMANPNESLVFTKYDATTGAVVWSKPVPDLFGRSVVTSPAGDVYVLADNGNLGALEYHLYKYSSAGDFQWQVDYTDSSPDVKSISKLMAGPDGNVYMTLANFSSSRFLKIQATDGDVVQDVPFGLGKIIVAFRGNDFVIMGLDFEGSNILVNYPSTFPAPSPADYVNTFTSSYPGYPYVSLNVEADGTAGVISNIPDLGFGQQSTLVRYSPTGVKLDPGNQTIISALITGAILDINGDYIAPTKQQCIKRLTPCSKLDVAITTPPQDQTACSGGVASFMVEATGMGLTYQWQKGADVLSDGGHISGATTATLTITGATATDDGGSYTCTVSDGCNHSETSAAATLSFVDGPAITGQPTAVEACAGSNINFAITATGQNVKYQWKKGSTALVDNARIAGAKTNSLSVSSIVGADAGSYTCEVTSDCFGTPMASQSASLTVYLPASVTTAPPPTASACAGGDLAIALEASGANITYQWKKGATDLVDGAKYAGAKTKKLTIKQLAAGDVGQYSCVVKGMCGAAATSSSTTVSMATASQIVTPPASKSVCAGANVSFSITASGLGLTYTWRKGNTLIADGGKYSGAGTSTLTITGATDAEAGAYICAISNPCGSDITSAAAQLTIDPAASIVSQSGNTALCTGEVGKVSVTVGAGNFQYQWKKDGVALTDGMAATGATTRELTILSASAADAGVYACEVKSGCGNPATSTGITVTVSQGTQILTQSTDLKTCADEKFTLTVTASGAGLTYSWKKNGAPLADGGNISGAKTATLSIAHASTQDEGDYVCEVTGACNGTAVSESIDVDIDPKPNLVLVTNIDCKGFQSQWSELVTDTNATPGEYTLYKKGSTTPLDLMEIDALGEYLIVKNTGTCSDTVTWNNTCVITGTESSFASRVNITPNPSNGLFKIQNLPRPLPFELYNAQGKLVLASKGPGADGFVDAQHLSDGLYLLTITNESGKGEVLRVIISKQP